MVAKLKKGTTRDDGVVFFRRARGCVNGEWWVTARQFELYSQQERQRLAAYYRLNRERALARSARAYRADPEKAKAAVYEWVTRNRHRVRATKARYRSKNPEVYAEAKSRRRARETPPRLADKRTMRQFYVTARRISRCLGVPFHVDHIIPLARGGAHHESNLQVIPGRVNQRKGAKVVD